MIKKHINKIGIATVLFGAIGILLSTFANVIVNGSGIDYLWATLASLGAISGVISVYYSNKKSLQFALYGILATGFKLAYPIVQITTGQGNINYSAILGQTMFLFIGLVQFINWKRWSIKEGQKEFTTRTFKKENELQMINMFLIMSVFWLIFSISMGNTGMWAVIDVMGGLGYLMGALLMSIGNIWAFAFFVMSNISWMVWTIFDFINAGDIVMTTIAIGTLFQVITYTLFAGIGYLEWKEDNENR